MRLDTAEAAIKARIQAQWPAIAPTVPLGFDNENFSDTMNPDGTAKPWVLIEIMWNGGEAMSIGSPGSNRVRREGHIWCHAFVPQGTGQSLASQLAGQAAAVFEEQDFSPVTCWGAEPGGERSGDENGNFYGQSVAVPFWFDEDA